MKVEAQDVLDLIMRLHKDECQQISDPTFKYGYIHALKRTTEELIKLFEKEAHNERANGV